MNNSNVSPLELSQAVPAVSPTDTVTAPMNRVNALMAEFIRGNLKATAAQIALRGIGGKDYSELSSDDQQLMDKYNNEISALAKYSSIHMISSLQLEMDNLAVSEHHHDSSKKRDLEDPSSGDAPGSKKGAPSNQK
jgi:hypothetical protein